MDKSKLFKEFLVCPECGEAIISKEEFAKDSCNHESKYCRKCGKKITSTYKEALANLATRV